MMASLVKEEKDPTSLLATLPLSAAVQSANPHETFQPIDCFQCSSSDMYMHICTYERVCVCVQSCKSFFLSTKFKRKIFRILEMLFDKMIPLHTSDLLPFYTIHKGVETKFNKDQ